MAVIDEPKLTDLVGAWLGGTEANTEFVRLEIDGHGQGILTVEYSPNETAEAYCIKSISLNNGSIHFSLTPFDNAEPLILYGRAHSSSMLLWIGGENHLWKRKLLLEPEEIVMKRISAVLKRANEVKLHNP